MLLCVPTQDDAGLSARVYGHFGSAPYFTLVDTVTQSTRAVPNPRSAHEHGQCRPLDGLRPYGFDAVVCRGMGRRALAMLRAEGVDVLVCDEETVSGLVQAVVRGAVTQLTDLDACQGGHHGEPHGGHHGVHHGA
jgi:predicted Fe-Mo cluster-binding NifX family protein